MNDHTATLTSLLDHLAAAIVAARTAGRVPYAEARRLFRRVDALQEQMEFLLVETKDYPDQQDDDYPPSAAPIPFSTLTTRPTSALRSA